MKFKDINPFQILYLKSDINYTEFHFIDGQIAISSYTLKRHQANTNISHFVRINQSVLVNPSYIEDFRKRGNVWVIILTNGENIKIPRRKVSLFNSINIKQLQ